MWSFLLKIKNAFVRHFTDNYYERNEAQLQREKWLVPKILKFNRWFLMPAAVFIQASEKVTKTDYSRYTHHICFQLFIVFSPYMTKRGKFALEEIARNSQIT